MGPKRGEPKGSYLPCPAPAPRFPVEKWGEKRRIILRLPLQSLPWLHIRITWRVLKSYQFLSSITDQLNQNFWGRGGGYGPGDSSKWLEWRITILAEVCPHGGIKFEGGCPRTSGKAVSKISLNIRLRRQILKEFGPHYSSFLLFHNMLNSRNYKWTGPKGLTLILMNTVLDTKELGLNFHAQHGKMNVKNIFSKLKDKSMYVSEVLSHNLFYRKSLKIKWKKNCCSFQAK